MNVKQCSECERNMMEHESTYSCGSETFKNKRLLK